MKNFIGKIILFLAATFVCVYFTGRIAMWAEGDDGNLIALIGIVGCLGFAGYFLMRIGSLVKNKGKK